MEYPRRSSSLQASASPANPSCCRELDTLDAQQTAFHLARRCRANDDSEAGFPQRLVEDPDGGRSLSLRQYQWRRDADRVLAGAEDEEPAFEARVNDLVAFGGRALLGNAIAHELDADHEAAAADVADDLMLLLQLAEPVEHECADLARVLHQRGLQELDRLERRRARHGIAAERAGV